MAISGLTYLRRLFIHGARSVVLHTKRDRNLLEQWIQQLESRAHRNVFVVALADKLARIAWAILTTGEPYRGVTVVAGYHTGEKKNAPLEEKSYRVC